MFTATFGFGEWFCWFITQSGSLVAATLLGFRFYSNSSAQSWLWCLVLQWVGLKVLLLELA
ncbi:hypothetical protein U1Q18_001132, partial [Sarracenia purpurea var. burkii]